MHKSCELKKMKVNQLLEIAKGLNIKGRHDMKKADLIVSILNVQAPNDDQNEKASKDAYIENAKIGMLIAFKVNDKKALSGMIEEIHKAGFVVKTKNGVRFNVRKSKVMWVKTGSRWPKGVYLALKGEQASERHQAAN